MSSQEKATAYWKENLRYLLILLSIWFAVSYGAGIIFKDALNNVKLGGFPLGFWFAQQGSIYVFVILIFVYVRLMNKLDKKYGYDPDYPINVFFKNAKDENLNAERFLNALAGPNGEKITFTKIESCCPFPSKRSEMGAGFLDVFELKWEGQKKPIGLYLNIYEKGSLRVPMGLSVQKN